MEVAGRLRQEAVITVPPLEWDGSLGPKEELVIARLGFLLNAYTVQGTARMDARRERERARARASWSFVTRCVARVRADQCDLQQ